MKQNKIFSFLISVVFFISISGTALAQGVVLDSVDLGESGFSLSYTEEFGVNGEPYLFTDNHINGPMGLFVDGDGALYVAEINGARVMKFDSAGDYEMSFGENGQAYHHEQFLNRPSSVVVDGDGHIWIVMRSAIKEYDTDGTIVQIFPEDAPWEEGNSDDRLQNPFEGIFNNDGSRFFVADTENNRIQIFSFDGDGKLTYDSTIDEGHSTIADAGLMMPQGIAFDSSGNLYVTDFLNQRVMQCVYNVGESNWECDTFFGVLGETGNDLSHLMYAADIYIDGSDQIFIADGGNSRVLKCTMAGVCAEFAGVTGEYGDDQDHLSFTTALTGDAAGNIYVSDSNNFRVQVFDSAGAFVTTYGVTGEPYVTDDAHFNRPVGVTVDTDGSIYLTENRGHRLIKLDAAGDPLWTVGEAGVTGDDNAHFGSFGGGIEGNPAIAADHKVYVADSSNNRIQVFNSDGSYFTTYGSYGNSNAEFDYPTNVAINPVNGDILVSDSNNQRVQVFSSAWGFKTTIGTTGSEGSGDGQFSWPQGLAVDASGNVYIGDFNNTRVQKCVLDGANYTCITLIGAPGEYNQEFGQLAPRSISVDQAGNIYVSDEWGARVQVFDQSGAFLTSIGGTESGQMSSQFSNPAGISVDSNGNVYVVDPENHRIEKFVNGTPKWEQVNLNGFGTQRANDVSALIEYKDDLYAAVYSFATGAQLWRQTSNGLWTAVVSDGFGDLNNRGIVTLEEFDGQLYAGTINQTNDEGISMGGQLWRSDTGDAGDWEQVADQGFGSSANFSIFRLSVLGEYLYASVYNENDGTSLWRSDTGDAGDWDFIMWGNGPQMRSVVEYNNMIIAGSDNGPIWNSDLSNGSSWAPINTPDGWGIYLQPYNGYLYLALNYSSGEEEPPHTRLYRCQTCVDGNWESLNFEANGLYDASMMVYQDQLILLGQHDETGMKVMKTTDGSNWEILSGDGFGDSRNAASSHWFAPDFDGFGERRNISSFRDEAVTVFNDRLYIGTVNTSNGGELWASDFTHFLYLPLVIR